MLSGKQRAQLRSLANGADTIVYIGKSGVTENVVTQAAEALKARELIKCKVQENCMLTAREACDELAGRTGAEGVQVIGSRFVIYKRNDENPVIKLEK